MFQKIPSAVADDPSSASFPLAQYGFDAPNLSSINDTSFDWWYFNTVSADLQSSICIVFYTALPSAFPFRDDSNVGTVVGIDSSFPKGTLINIYLEADDAVITTVEDGSSGDFRGSGARWAGKPDMSPYTVTIDAPEEGVVGTFELVSKAPAHYHCGGAGPGKYMSVGSHVGWNNIPDAVEDVNFTTEGGELAFEGGIAYHDKNWEGQLWQYNVGTSYWGHARLGPCALVWFDLLGLDSTNYVSAYVSLNDTIITSSCKLGSAKVRPTGRHSEYPPTVWSGAPRGFSIQIDLGWQGILDVNVTNEASILGGRVYYRWIGSLIGSIDGVEVMEGFGMLEKFAMVVE